MNRLPITWREFVGNSPVDVQLRIDGQLWSTVSYYINDFTYGERAGVLLIRSDAFQDSNIVVAEQFIPITDEYLIDGDDGLNYDGRFNLQIADMANQTGCGAILVHSHPYSNPPLPSTTDTNYGKAFLSFMRRRRPNEINGLLVVGNTTITGVCDTTLGLRLIREVSVAGIPSYNLLHEHYIDDNSVSSYDRQLLAIGQAGQNSLKRATVAIVGLSGGGSHIAQQLIHAGVGKLIVIDNDVVDETNIRRLVGAIRSDIDQTPKVDIPVRLALTIRPEVNIITIMEEFPSVKTIRHMQSADIIIGCVDNWVARDNLNSFALKYRIPYIDIGATIVPTNEHGGMRVSGQIVIVTPDGPCLRCMRLVTNERIAEGREQKQYADKVHEPQVVSINGTLASEAVTSSLMLLAGDDRLVRRRRYSYPQGLITMVEAERDINCPSCRGSRLIP